MLRTLFPVRHDGADGDLRPPGADQERVRLQPSRSAPGSFEIE